MDGNGGLSGRAQPFNPLSKRPLTAVNQYWLHYRLLDNWGYRALAKIWRKESIEEMQHADKLIERIIFLDGFPNMQRAAGRSLTKLPGAARCSHPAFVRWPPPRSRENNQWQGGNPDRIWHSGVFERLLRFSLESDCIATTRGWSRYKFATHETISGRAVHQLRAAASFQRCCVQQRASFDGRIRSTPQSRLRRRRR
jgi:Ferritin-like domain